MTTALLLHCEQPEKPQPQIPSPDRPGEVGTGTRGKASEQKAQDRADHLRHDQERHEDQPENRREGEHDQPEDHPQRPPAPIQLQNPSPYRLPSGLRLRNLMSRRRTSVDLQNFGFNRIRHAQQNRRSTRQGNSKFCWKLELTSKSQSRSFRSPTRLRNRLPIWSRWSGVAIIILLRPIF